MNHLPVKIPHIRASVTSCIITLYRRSQFSVPYITSRYLRQPPVSHFYEAYNTLPMYLREDTGVMGCPYVARDILLPYLTYSTTRRWSFSFIPPPTELSGEVAAIEVPSGHKNVAFRASRVGSVTLLQDHMCIPHVVVQKMDPEVGPDHRVLLTPLQWAPNHVHIIIYLNTPKPGPPPQNKLQGTITDGSIVHEE